MANEPDTVELSATDLREVARYAAESAQEVLSIFEELHPDDQRPRVAVEAAWTFAEGGERTNLQRTSALAAHKAAQETTSEAAREAARAAGHAAAAAYLHPLAKATQVKHILGAAAHAAHAAELVAGGDHSVGAQRIEQARQRATPALVAVLRRYPTAPSSGNRVAQLMRALDASLRSL
ncbi:MAG: exonuclease SbcC [Chloroflexales bacterium]|nr:exonuclease SbcC [Chloroflexales bacterium]